MNVMPPFTAWALAVVLSEPGFHISASPWAVTNEDDYLHRISDSRYRTRHPDVILVTAAVGCTDPLAPQPTPTDPPVAYKPQLIPIPSLPWVAFQDMADNTSRVNTQYLSDVWEYAFDQATMATEPPQLRKKVRIKPVADNGLI
jgi:hypothetical protein